ncbi:YcxB family protein [Blastopirellula sp. JC732]|uniref:YcxB family protein n=1 Tax=Blastopirellula sediminis TaxID=2894196 RepID=A0A9X1MMU8_9BACT|nr:YcxB family protein [Blastopirellula sediminis]MCC9607542.1 YcxB family protein [Blastopirellula sediminis]MCC9629165.1 YcxB family protein [Blastopirellula sediminis]
MNGPHNDNPFQSPVIEQGSDAPAGEAIVAEGTFTQRDLKATYRALVYNWRTVAVLLVISLVMFSGTLGPIAGNYWTIGAAIYPLFCLAPLVVMLEILFYAQTYWRTKNAELKKEPEQQRITLDEQGVHFESLKMTSFLPWSRFTRLQKRRRLLVLVLKPFGFISLPSHYFESQDAFLAARKLISERIGTTSDVEPPPTEEYVDVEIPGAVSAAGTLTKKEFYTTCWLLVRSGILTTLLMVAGLVGIACYFVAADLTSGRVQSVPGSLMFLFAAAIFSIRWIRYYLGIRRTYRDVTSRARMRWTITAEKLFATSETFNLNIGWTEINRVIFRDEALILVYQKTQAFTLPRRFFASEEDWLQVNEWARRPAKSTQGENA